MARVLQLVTLHDASIRVKLGVLVAILSVPIIVLLAIQYQARNADVTLAHRESDGLTYVTGVIPLLKDVQTHRSLAMAVANGDTGSAAALSASGQAVERDLAALSAMDAKFGASFGTKDFVASINSQWTQVKRDTSNPIDSVSFASHSQLIDQGILPLITQAGESSRLFLDPAASGIKSVGAITENTLQYVEALSKLQAYGLGVALSRQNQPVTGFQKTFIQNQESDATAASDTLLRYVNSAISANNNLNATIRPVLLKNQAATLSFFASLNGSMVDAAAVRVPAATLAADGNLAVSSALDIFSAARAPLVPEFQDRVSTAQRSLLLEIGIAVGGVIVALLISGAVARSVTRPLSQLAEVADRMSLGELDVEIDVTGNNEIGQLAESLRRMQASLRSAIERLRSRRTAA